MCGENSSSAPSPLIMSGSPPRVRGKRRHSFHRMSSFRITPACAGKTRSRRRAAFSIRDHPRVCGENAKIMLNSLYGKGSPPRVRGKRLKAAITVVPIGITPACAGKTCPSRATRAASRDHPRVCGENWDGEGMADKRSGSPPRVRGKHFENRREFRLARITPACAGKTQARRRVRRRDEDHPRVCGENKDTIVQLLLNLGSPPRVRGKLRTTKSSKNDLRITPACAGKTGNNNVHIVDRKDHPRVCGENAGRLQMTDSVLGSPPRVRGKRVAMATRISAWRITPACAGKTF